MGNNFFDGYAAAIVDLVNILDKENMTFCKLTAGFRNRVVDAQVGIMMLNERLSERMLNVDKKELENVL